MFTPEFWESISQNRYESIDVSIDAATRETYQKVRCNANWDRLRLNLDFISELRRRNIFSFLSINFVVMKSNYQEMKDFVELGRKLGCDRISFKKIFGLADISENINFSNNQKVFGEIAAILTDPLFNLPEVDTALIDTYREYLGRRVSVRDGLVREWLWYFPLK